MRSDATEPVPMCTTDPRRCELCDMIRQIFAGFPGEEDPGCETVREREPLNSAEA